jgi:hypothetical protein
VLLKNTCVTAWPASAGRNQRLHAGRSAAARHRRRTTWRQLKPINYTEAITTAVLDLVANLLKTPAFVSTLRVSP